MLAVSKVIDLLEDRVRSTHELPSSRLDSVLTVPRPLSRLSVQLVRSPLFWVKPGDASVLVGPDSDDLHHGGGGGGFFFGPEQDVELPLRELTSRFVE